MHSVITKPLTSGFAADAPPADAAPLANSCCTFFSCEAAARPCTASSDRPCVGVVEDILAQVVVRAPRRRAAAGARLAGKTEERVTHAARRAATDAHVREALEIPESRL